MKIQQTSLLQTGIAIGLTLDGKEISIPLFSQNPVIDEIPNFKQRFPEIKIKDVFLANSVLKYKIEDTIKEFKETNKFLPENYMNELRSGFPFIYNSIEYNPLPIGLSYT